MDAPARRSAGQPIVSAALALLLALVLVGCNDTPSGPGSAPGGRPQARPALPVQAYAVERQDLSRSVVVSGTVEPLRSVRLAARTSGIITRLDVEEGDRVREGQRVALIDVREQRAELRRVRAALLEETANLERLEALAMRGQIDTASVERAASQLERTRAEVELWETRVAFGELEATLDGVVTERLAEPGEAVSQFQSLLTIADTSTLVVRFGFSELDVASLAPGMEVPVRIDALRGQPPLPGRVRRIMPATDGPSRLVTVEVELAPPAETVLRLGFLARAEVMVERRQGVLAVPLGSIGVGAQGSHVMVIDDEQRLRRRPVVTGPSRGTWREILEGLAPGEVIVNANPTDFGEGQVVRVVSWLDGADG
ncbi:MAG: efflux RND transporter periplasmic adaptor subunit [Gammaproteobacteria bacterium]|nr:efflux RND transporter periplasmic adaptor subunit [Gammaproteobacteria bacterium]